MKEKLDEVDKGIALKVSAEDIASAIYGGVKAGSSIDVSSNSTVSTVKEGLSLGKISMTPEGYSVGIKTAVDLKKPFDIHQARLDIAERLHKKIMSGKYDYDELQLFIDLTDGM